MQALTLKNKTYSYPSDMHELTSQQLEAVLHILTAIPDAVKQKLAIIQTLLPKTLTTHLRKYPEQLHKLSLTINFVLQNPYYTQDLIQFTHKRKTYMGAGNSFQYLTFDEYINIDALFFDLEKEPANLDKITAILYRRKIKTDSPDKRKPFHSQEIDILAKEFTKLPIKYKLNALYYFIGCRKQIVQSYPEVFPPPKDEIATPPQEPYNWNELIFSISKQGTWKSLAELMSENIWTVMEYLKYLNKPKEQNQ